MRALASNQCGPGSIPGPVTICRAVASMRQTEALASVIVFCLFFLGGGGGSKIFFEGERKALAANKFTNS